MKLLRFVLLALILGGALSACDTFQPSQLCGEETEADHQAFTQFFSDLQVSALDGSYVEDSNEQVNRVFEGPVSLAVNLVSLEETELRLCIFGAKRNGAIVFDELYSLTAGQRSISLGEYSKGPYIIRVYVDGKLVENISFLIR